jgi:hypothetical protein
VLCVDIFFLVACDGCDNLTRVPEGMPYRRNVVSVKRLLREVPPSLGRHANGPVRLPSGALVVFLKLELADSVSPERRGSIWPALRAAKNLAPQGRGIGCNAKWFGLVANWAQSGAEVGCGAGWEVVWKWFGAGLASCAARCQARAGYNSKVVLSEVVRNSDESWPTRTMSSTRR